MRKYFRTKLFGLVLATSVALQAAPLFPDVPEGHWAKDAVAALAAKGLVEGYPDGTFKGDRSASRWEVAMVAWSLAQRACVAQFAQFAAREHGWRHRFAASRRDPQPRVRARVKRPT